MIFSTIEKWKSMIIGPRGPEHHVIVYSRIGCGCCDTAMAELKKASEKYHLNIECIDIDQDEELARKYDLEVPVVAIDGKIRFKGKINPVLLERLLKQPIDSQE